MMKNAKRYKENRKNIDFFYSRLKIIKLLKKNSRHFGSCQNEFSAYATELLLSVLLPTALIFWGWRIASPRNYEKGVERLLPRPIVPPQINIQA